MARLLLNLRDVPEDEADEIRALLDAQGIACYETEPNRWGFSAGGIWLSDEADAERAGPLLAAYQQQRREQGQVERGSLPSFWDQVRDRPLRIAGALIAAVALIALITLPFLGLH
ncbi:MAG: DUF6164 family protein [Tahibacter sp.]